MNAKRDAREVDEEMDETSREKGGEEEEEIGEAPCIRVLTHTSVNTRPAESSASARGFVIKPPLYFLYNCRL